ncbi:sigma-70 family RNA polymerase sigma factor [Yinghuangia seranimata]|uniref:sigma-70 family RNA polymerase sigma factor n=1 Tax=Yinghuangia seranimata TaxID=408067 RepID=UPI00248C5B6C|nr:sigma-70 family RNA polymerase sigma factor [Yinghuangia seranimata]MDI2127763.1 sigma-70 family RNA polymerase sigma factor [Yinghuangia seranimata]
MEDFDFLAARFEDSRPHLRAVAYRMLGSLTQADEAVQDAWFRLHDTRADEVDNLVAWLTTVVARVCLDRLRARTAHAAVCGTRLPDPVVDPADGVEPEHEALLADSVGLALLVVLDSLAPAERLAFVLHDMFAMPLDEVAAVVDRSPAEARRLAASARRRVQGTAAAAEPDAAAQRPVVDAFLAATRAGDFAGLLAVLHPGVVLRADYGTVPVVGGATRELHGADDVAAQAVTFARFAGYAQPALVNGTAGLVTAPDGRPMAVMGFTITDGRITEINILADPVRLRGLDLDFLDGVDHGVR